MGGTEDQSSTILPLAGQTSIIAFSFSNSSALFTCDDSDVSQQRISCYGEPDRTNLNTRFVGRSNDQISGSLDRVSFELVGLSAPECIIADRESRTVPEANHADGRGTS